MGPQDAPTFERAVAALRRGGLAIFPTETFYGLGCRAENPAATARVAKVKGRRLGSPFPVIAADRVAAEALWSQPPPRIAHRLIDAFWPGPLTVVLPARPGLPPEVASTGEIGVRVSSHPIAAALAAAVGPLLATSANRSGAPEVAMPDAVDPAIVSAADAVVAGGPTRGGRPSTVVAVREGRVVVLREGAIAADVLEGVVGPLGRR